MRMRACVRAYACVLRAQVHACAVATIMERSLTAVTTGEYHSINGGDEGGPLPQVQAPVYTGEPIVSGNTVVHACMQERVLAKGADGG